MQIFITGTDTDIGKTTVCSWLCLHTAYDYFKPIQTGTILGRDSEFIAKIARSKIHPEIYEYETPVSPHLAAKACNESISLDNITLPTSNNLIVEGAGGLLVPINDEYLIIDLIKRFAIPVILVASSRLGTINHTLLSLEALRARNIQVLGVIVSGDINLDTCASIEFYGKVKVLAQIPLLTEINHNSLGGIPLTPELKAILQS